MADVQVNQTDLARILGRLEGLSRALSRRVLRQELNRSTRQARTDATDRVRADLPQLPRGTILRRFSARLARGSNLETEIVVSKRPINILRFGARATKSGGVGAVSVLGETRGPFKHGFVIRGGRGGEGARDSRFAVMRVRAGERFAARLPVKGIFGPTVVGVMERHRGPVIEKAGERLLANIERRIDSELRGRKGGGE